MGSKTGLGVRAVLFQSMSWPVSLEDSGPPQLLLMSGHCWVSWPLWACHLQVLWVLPAARTGVASATCHSFPANDLLLTWPILN